ncbi:HMG box family protein [Trichomonas vaginalis G3]|uniref:HMG box family protein n=1 Tax=Trichomonas vaginalis (strain ATCC PRA-98 / G3) TaxID=412133 RepID=A2EC93_TRIV3|nr:SRY (sex determining region Y)-box family [Trichomonas vaginalis G3]EAY09770.1 HMG box family protein [Trichomonas vaginalis G3]KAI5550933.1 SRY (sex determining region Y)-box family [Trichomonas vaginalis G3]|eukprot:XP_001321993.1 HMG box family protein [Trichomonas vaginalis G3]
MEYDSTIESPIRNQVPGPVDGAPSSKVKRPLNTYNLFYLERQPKLKAENPLLNGNDISRLVATEWKDLTNEQKKPYRDAANELYNKFKQENPNYHYEKTDKKNNKKKKNQDEQIFPDFMPQNNQSSSSNQIMSSALLLAQFVMSRKDVQNDIFQAIQQGKFYFEQTPQMMQPISQQLPTQTFDQLPHMDSIVTDLE